MTKSPISQNDLQTHLQEQIGFINTSADSFDNGTESEAKRLAATIRVLVHDTPKSISLLMQLGMKNIQFLDQAIDMTPGNFSAAHALVMIRMSGNAQGMSAKYVPRFHRNPSATYVDFDAWWMKPVFKDKQNNILTRKDLVLIMANEDGGAHIDPKINNIYAGLKFDNALGWMDQTGKKLDGAVPASIRQISYELLTSLQNNTNP